MTQVVTELIIDARGAQSGSVDFIRMMDAAQKAVDRFMDKERAMAQSVANGGATMVMSSQTTTRLAAAIDRLKASMDPTHISTRKLNSSLLLIDDAVKRLGMSQVEANNLMDMARDKYDAVAAAARRQKDELMALAGAERLAASSADGQSFYNRVVGVRDIRPGAARDSASVFEAAEREAADFERRITSLRAQINPLGAAQDRLNAELAEYSNWASRGAIDARELADAQALAMGRFDATTAAINAQNAAIAGGRQGGGFHTTNLMFQMQDVGMMAAMGQSPMATMLQQGPQIAGVFHQIGNGREVVKSLGAALMGLISPLSLVTIAAVGFGAAGIQAFASWVSGLGPVRRSMEEHREWLSKILRGYDEVDKAVSDYIDKASRLPASLARLEIADGLNDDIERLRVVQSMIDDFRIRPDAAVQMPWQTLNEDLAVLRELKSQFDAGLTTAEQFAGQLKLISMNGFVDGEVRALADGLRSAVSEAAGLKVNIEGGRAALLDLSAEAQEAAIRMANLRQSFNDLNSGVYSDGGLQNILDRQTEALGKLKGMVPDIRTAQQQAADELTKALANPSEAFRKEAQANYDLFMKNTGILDARREAERAGKERATSLEQLRKAYDGVISGGREFIAQQQLEGQVLGLNDATASLLRHRYDLLNQAKQAGIDLDAKIANGTMTVRQQLEGLAVDMAETEMATRRLTEIYNFGKDTFGSFFADMKSGLREGQRFWEALGNAGANALDKIADRALSMAANGIFDLIFGAVMGGLGGGFGTIGVGGVGIPSGGFIPGLTGPSLPSFAGGGYTWDGPRSGGLDGMGGRLALLHPQETVIDHRRPASNNQPAAANVNIQIIDQRRRGTIQQDETTDANGEKQLRLIIRDEVQQARRRGAVGF